MALLPPCLSAGVLLSLNVSDSNRMVSLTPALKHPGVPGIRVEVNGQVGPQTVAVSNECS